MTTPGLATTARAIVADGKGILAADETPGTLTKRLTARGIESTPDTRRAYREMFFSTRGVARFISGVILQDETIRQRNAKGTPLADLLAEQGQRVREVDRERRLPDAALAGGDREHARPGRERRCALGMPAAQAGDERGLLLRRHHGERESDRRHARHLSE